MKTTERDVRKYKEEVEETPVLESKIMVFSRPSIESIVGSTITPPKHEKRVLKKAEKPSVYTSSSGVTPEVYDVEFHVFNESKDEDFQVDKNIIEENVPVGVSDKELTVESKKMKILPKERIPIDVYNPRSDLYWRKADYYDKYILTYGGEYNVKAKLLKDGVELAESNQLSWGIFEEQRRKRQEEQERQEKERKQAEIERLRKGIEEQDRITKREIEMEERKRWLHDHAYSEYRRLFGDDVHHKKNICICR